MKSAIIGSLALVTGFFIGYVYHKATQIPSDNIQSIELVHPSPHGQSKITDELTTATNEDIDLERPLWTIKIRYSNNVETVTPMATRSIKR